MSRPGPIENATQTVTGASGASSRSRAASRSASRARAGAPRVLITDRPPLRAKDAMLSRWGHQLAVVAREP